MSFRSSRALVGAILAVVAVAGLWFVPRLLIAKGGLTRVEELDAENDVRAILVQCGGAIAIGSGLFFTARQLQLTRRRHDSELFVEALKQLESREASVALGGVYSLQELGRSSSAYAVPVFEVLTALIRSKATPALDISPRPTLSAEIEAALFAVGEWPAAGRARRLRLDAIDLSNRDLGRIRLQGANLWKAKLVNVNLQGAQLRGANFQSADLRRANLKNADLTNAILNGANIEGADLDGTDLRGAQLAGIDLTKAKGTPVTD